MSNEIKQVLIKVPESTKEKWKDAAKQEYGSIKHLVTLSVSKELDDKYVDRDLIDNIETDSLDEEVIDSINDKINLIIDRLDSMESKEHVSLDMDEEELQKLGLRVQDVIPVVESQEQLRKIEVTGLEEADEVPKITGQVRHISDWIEVPEEKVRQALIYISNNTTADVKSIVDSGRRRWYVEK